MCKLLRIPNPSTLKQIVTHVDYMAWRELWDCDPWDEDRADLRAAKIICAALAPWSKNGRPPRPIEFMPYATKQQPIGQSDAQIKEIATIVASRWNPEGNK